MAMTLDFTCFFLLFFDSSTSKFWVLTRDTLTFPRTSSCPRRLGFSAAGPLLTSFAITCHHWCSRPRRGSICPWSVTSSTSSKRSPFLPAARWRLGSPWTGSNSSAPALPSTGSPSSRMCGFFLFYFILIFSLAQFIFLLQ